MPRRQARLFAPFNHELEAILFTSTNAESVGPAVHDLYSRHKTYVWQFRGGEATNFSSAGAAIKNARADSQNPDLRAYLFRKQDVAVGVGWVVMNQLLLMHDTTDGATYRSPATTWFRQWNDPTVTRSDRAAMQYLMLSCPAISPYTNVMAAIEPGEEEYSAAHLGFIPFAENPQTLTQQQPNDSLHLLHDNRPVQVFVRRRMRS